MLEICNQQHSTLNVLNNFAFVLTGIFFLKNKYYMMVRVMLIVLLADVEVLKKTWRGLLDYRAEFKKKKSEAKR